MKPDCIFDEERECAYVRRNLFTGRYSCAFRPTAAVPIIPCVHAIPGINPNGPITIGPKHFQKDDKISMPTHDAIGVLLALHEILICADGSTRQGRMTIRAVEQIAKIFEGRNL